MVQQWKTLKKIFFCSLWFWTNKKQEEIHMQSSILLWASPPSKPKVITKQRTNFTPIGYIIFKSVGTTGAQRYMTQFL